MLRHLGCDFVAISGQLGDAKALPFIIRRAPTLPPSDFLAYDEAFNFRTPVGNMSSEIERRAGYKLVETDLWGTFKLARLSIFQMLDNRFFGAERKTLTPSRDFFNSLMEHGVLDAAIHQLHHLE